MFTFICLTSLIRQRISVPELRKEKWRNYLVLISGSTSVLCMITMIFYNNETLKFSKMFIHTVDNIFFSFYIVTTFIYSVMTYLLLEKMNILELPKNCACLLFKKYLIVLMGVQLICCKFYMIYWIYSDIYLNLIYIHILNFHIHLDLLSLLLISCYNPFIYPEKVLLNSLILCMNINSITFMFLHAFFILSLKYDMYYVNMNLNIRPDLEYFLDLTEYTDIKNI